MGCRGDGTIPTPGFMPVCIPREDNTNLFKPLKEQDGAESLLPEATNPVEREERVNLLWIGYANDRFQNAPASWRTSVCGI